MPRRPWRAQGPPLPERRGQRGGGKESRSAAAPGTVHPPRRPARRVPAHRRGLSPALPATSPGDAPGNRVPNFLDPQRPARSRPGLCGGRAGPHRGVPGPAQRRGGDGTPPDAHLRGACGALEETAQHPRPAWASRPAWSPLAPRPPFPLLPDTWGRTIRRLLFFSLNFSFLNSF